MALTLRVNLGESVKFVLPGALTDDEFFITLDDNVGDFYERFVRLRWTIPELVQVVPADLRSGAVLAEESSLRFEGPPIGDGQSITIVISKIAEHSAFMSFIAPREISILRDSVLNARPVMGVSS